MSQDIHALEIEFAKNPTLDACLPLCEAYLAVKRYMEAMVVCKKGIKNAQVSDPRGRVMLARVFVEQGKLPKAEAELVQLTAEFPDNGSVLELQGRVLMDQGRGPDAIRVLNQALRADPTLKQARAWLTALGAAAPAAVAPAVTDATSTPPSAAAAPPVAPTLPSAASRATTMPPPNPGGPPPGLPRPPPSRPTAGSLPTLPPISPPPEPLSLPHEPAARRPLGNLDDFFAPNALGFSDENSNVETAGPGRLTILGFVPKSAGSLKTTLLVFFAVVAVVAVYLSIKHVQFKSQHKITTAFAKVRTAINDDRYGRYKDAIKLANSVLEIKEDHVYALSAVAFAEAVLATEHNEPGALEKAQAAIARVAPTVDNQTEYGIAARALIAYASKKYDEGLAGITPLIDKGANDPFVLMEAYRLMSLNKPNDKATLAVLRQLIQSVSSQPRVFNYLGWHYYAESDWSRASKFFDQTLQNGKGHPMALLGRSLVSLDQGVGLEAKQKDITKDVQEVFALPAEDRSPAVSAVAHFVYSQLYRWQTDTSKADEEYRTAVKLDPTNPIFPFRRGTALLAGGHGHEAVEMFRQVLAMEPTNVKYLKRLAEAQTVAHSFDEAKTTLDKLATQAPHDSELPLLQGHWWLAKNDPEQAIKAYQKVSREDGADPFSLAQIATSAAMRTTDNKARAIKLMDDLLSKLPEGVSGSVQARVWCELGQDYEATGNHAKALQSYENGINQYRYEAGCQWLLCRAEGGEACKTYLQLEPHGRYADEARSRH